MTKIINLFGSPGSGKSTLSAGLFFELKLAGYNVELVNEYAKEKVWSEDAFTLRNQAYITMKQYYKQSLSHGKVHGIITDSPILLGAFYERGEKIDMFVPFIKEIFNKHDNINFMLVLGEKAKRSFSQKGRLHSLEDSLLKEKEIKTFLVENSISHQNIIVNGRECLQTMLDIILEQLPLPQNLTF